MTPRPARETALCRLLYTSHSRIGGEPAERMAKIRQIAETSAKRNREANLTGSLLFVQNSFVQVLEGPPETVEEVFEAICCDFRHEEVKLIDMVSAQERLFPEWEMALLSDEEETSIALRDDLQEIRFLVGVNAREAERQMRSLLESQAV